MRRNLRLFCDEICREKISTEKQKGTLRFALMKLEVEQYKRGIDFTLSKLFVNDKLFCWILEDAIRDKKEDGKTAIPRGKYEVIINESIRFKRLLPLLLDIPNYRGIRIHPGNTSEDTEGCLLPGLEVSMIEGKQAVTHSREAFEMLFKKMQEAQNKGEDITIELK